MPSHRSLRIAEAIREVVSSAILFDVADPRVRAVTVLRVEVSSDLRNATIFVSMMGTAAEQQNVMKGLKSATGFLQARVAARLQIRFTPVLVFRRDDSVKRSVEMSKLIDDTLNADRDRISADTDSSPTSEIEESFDEDDDFEGEDDADDADEENEDESAPQDRLEDQQDKNPLSRL